MCLSWRDSRWGSPYHERYPRLRRAVWVFCEILKLRREEWAANLAAEPVQPRWRSSGTHAQVCTVAVSRRTDLISLKADRLVAREGGAAWSPHTTTCTGRFVLWEGRSWLT